MIKKAFFIVLVLGILFVIAQVTGIHSRIDLLLTKCPSRLSESLVGMGDNCKVVFLRDNICLTCPVGHFLSQMSGNSNILYIVPKEYSSNDISNMVRHFGLSGPIIKSDLEIERYYRKICRCNKCKENMNIFIEIEGNIITKTTLIG